MNTAKKLMDGRRLGATLLEVSLALSVLLSAAVLLAQFVMASSGQRRVTDQRRLAMEELSNRMERALAMKFAEVDSTALNNDQFSSQTIEKLPAAKLTAEVSEEAGPPAGKRIRLALSWQNSAGEEVQPQTLTAWTYRRREGTP